LRDGTSIETGLWPADLPLEPAVLWRKSIGAGFSGASIADGRLYTAWIDGGSEVLFCLDARSGSELWRFPIDREFQEENGNGPRATPTVDGPLVFALSSRAMLHAVDRVSGRPAWSLDLRKAIGEMRVEQRGYASSPLILGDLLIVQVGPSPGTAVVALDKFSGELRWKTQSGRAGLSSPIAVTLDGVLQVVAAIGSGLVGVDPTTGAQLWFHPWTTQFDLNIATPLFVPPDRFLISSGYDKGSALVAVAREGGTWTATEQWTNRLFRSHFNSPVLHGSAIYGFDNAFLKAISVEDGRDLWRARGFGKGSLILADGRLVVQAEDGELAIVEATPEGYQEVLRAEALSGRSWTPPSLAHGVVFTRNHESLIAIELVAGAAASPAATVAPAPDASSP
jgi:outer membrane protein assembly factor BamB